MLPGYGGHVPTAAGPETVGLPYGRATATVMTRNDTLYRGVRRSASAEPRMRGAAAGERDDERRPSHVPGYAGHVPKLHEEVEQSFGRATRAALNRGPGQPLLAARLPSDPASEEAAQGSPAREHYFGREGHRPLARGTVLEPKGRRGPLQVDLTPSQHLPGYAGHVPFLRSHFMTQSSFGVASRAAVAVQRSMTPQPGRSSPSTLFASASATPGASRFASAASTGSPLGPTPLSPSATIRALNESPLSQSRTLHSRTVSLAATLTGSPGSHTGAPRSPLAATGHMPGYHGHVPTTNDYVGVSFSRATQKAMGGAVRDMSPRALPRTYIGTAGYAGHVPDQREVVGKPHAKVIETLVQARASSPSK